MPKIDAIVLISIHTPHTRCDTKSSEKQNVFVRFQSTHLIRGVTILRFSMSSYVKFQSTHLIRGVTFMLYCHCNTTPYFNPHTSYEVTPLILSNSTTTVEISIHTPHTRCDKVQYIVIDDSSKISIHTPHTRCDTLYKLAVWSIEGISIHTPHTRCDKSLLAGTLTKNYFNPHTSYEVWPLWLETQQYPTKFQSTHLIWGVTGWGQWKNKN